MGRAMGGRRTVALVVTAVACVVGCGTSPDVVGQRSTQHDDDAGGSGDPSVDQDPNVRVGMLDNGLTYYVRENQTPGYSAELRLVVNAGSGREQPDQSGVAHFLEHMMFNGTDKFPKNELIDVLRLSGAQFGADVNAYTDYDETVFQLSVPTKRSEDEEPLTTGLDILEEWMSAATLDPEAVVDERGVVLEEWRLSQQSSSGRVSDTIDGLFLSGTPYEGRSPIGTEAAIRAMTPDVLRRFYDDWYRPDNAAVIVVGDFDADMVEDRIKEQFEDLRPRTSAALPGPLSVVPSPVARAALLDDPDLTTTQIEVTVPVTARPDNVASLSTHLIDQLAFDMIVTRLSGDAAAGAPFDAVFISNNDVVRSLDALSVVVDSKSSSVVESMNALLDEFERARRFGFDDNELAIAAKGFLATAQSRYDGRDSEQDVSFAETYVDAFLTGTPILTAPDEHRLITDALADISADDVSDGFRDRWSITAPRVLLIGPDVTASIPDEATVLDAVAALDSRELSPRERVELAGDELMEPPAPVEETNRTEMAEYPEVFLDDPVRLTFANGATVVISPTEIVSGSVILMGRSRGGTAVLADEDVADAFAAVPVVSASGVGDLGPTELAQHVASTSATLEMSINIATDDVYGSSSTTDLESMMQLLHLFMTAPRVDEVAFERVVSQLRDAAAQPDADQQVAGYEALARARYAGNPRLQETLTLDEVERIDGPTIARLWSERFGNAADWTFAILGDFDRDEVIDLARRYVGTLASTGIADESIDILGNAPPGVVSETAHGGTGDKGNLLRLYSADLADTTRNRVITDVAGEMMAARLDEGIREELGQSYSPTASFSLTAFDERNGHFNAFFEIGSAPDQLAALSTRLSEDVAQLTTDGPTEADFQESVAVIGEWYDTVSNEVLADVLLNHRLGYGETIDEYIDRSSWLHEITREDITDFFRTNLPADRYVEIQVLPR